MEAAPQALKELRQIAFDHVLIIPYGHGLDVALNPSYLRRLINGTKGSLRPGDTIELRCVGLSWIAKLLVVSISMGANSIATKLIMPPTFLLCHADRSPVHVLEQINALQHEHGLGKVGEAEYEAKLRILHTLRDHQRYPTEWLSEKLAELSRALEARLLTKPQYETAAAELRAAMNDDQLRELALEPDPASAVSEKPRKKSAA